MRPARLALAAFWLTGGVLHFVRPGWYEAIMPPWVPAHSEMVAISGAAEIAAGIGVLVPGAERITKWWILALLLAVYPANIHMAIYPEDVKGLPDVPRWALWARLPLQFLFAWWAVRVLRTRERAGGAQPA